jgi:hypothetical protein
MSSTRGDGLALASDALGAEAMLWSSLHQPNWQRDLEKTTRIYVVVYPSNNQCRTFGPSPFTNALPSYDESFPCALTPEQIQGLGYGIHVEPPKDGGGMKKLFKSQSKAEATMFTFEQDSIGGMSLKTRAGPGTGLHGMLARFLVAQHDKKADVHSILDKVEAGMNALVLDQKNGGPTAIRATLAKLQAEGIVEKWDLDNFFEVADIVVEQQKKEGTQKYSTTTVNYLAHVQGN